MTSSNRHLKSGQPKWNYEIQKYKDFNPFFEPNLISILFIAYGRHGLTKATLESTAKAVSLYQGEVEWIFGEQGPDKDNRTLFENFECERKILIFPNQNYGINNMFNNLFRCSRGEYCFLLENDWLNFLPQFNFLKYSKEILDEDPNIGVVNLRDVFDPWENNGFNKPDYSPYTCQLENLKNNQEIKLCKTSSGFLYLKANHYYMWNNNPNLVRKSIYFDCGCYPEPPFLSDPRHGESVFQEKVFKTNYWGSYINAPVFHHIGGARRKEFEKMY